MYVWQHAAVAELSQCALSGTDLPTLMRQTVVLVANLLAVDHSKLLELLPDGNALVLRQGVGWNQETIGHTTVEVEATSSAGRALLSNAPVIVENWCSEREFQQPDLSRNHGVISELCVTIGGPWGPFGVLSADSTEHRKFTHADIQLLQSIANVLALAIDRARLSDAEERAHERTREIERRHRAAEGLHETLTMLNSSQKLDDILAHIIEQACRLLGTPAGAIYRLRREEAVLKPWVAWGPDADEVGLNLPMHWDPAREAVVKRHPVAIVDLRVARQAYSTSVPGRACLADRYPALLVIPLLVKADVYGVLVLYDLAPRCFSDEEVRLAVTLGANATLAIENMRLVGEARCQAIQDERQRLSRDLHDSVTQALYGITLHAHAATRLMSLGDTSTSGKYLSELERIAQEAFEEMRLLVFDLRPSSLDQEGLPAALQARLEAVEGRINLQTKLIVEGVTRLPPFIEQALYRISQEALNNALKHAHAQGITVVLRQEHSCVRLEIIDDGIGFDVARAYETGGWGLRGIDERAGQIGGRLALLSEPGSGTRLQVVVPL